MEIIAHRGNWKRYSERNTRAAFFNAVRTEMGTETDFRDFDGKLKISHDIADSMCMDAEDLFSMYKNSSYTLALNIKADGIQHLLRQLIEKYEIKSYFCFDMSVPDMLIYKKVGLRYFVRESEYEEINKLYETAAGVWVDGFEGDEWITEKRIEAHLNRGKKVCIVSPELHGRAFEEKWKYYREMRCVRRDNLILCTDYPERAKVFFYE